MYYNRKETFHEGLEKEQLKKETDILSVLYFYYTIIFYVYNPLDRITTYPSRVSFCEKETRGTRARFSVPLANHTPLQPPSPHSTTCSTT